MRVKSLSILMLFLVFQSVTFAQIIDFKNEKLKAKLIESYGRDENFNLIKIDANNDQEIDIEETKKIRRINIEDANVGSIDEMKYFENLIPNEFIFREIGTF